MYRTHPRKNKATLHHAIIHETAETRQLYSTLDQATLDQTTLDQTTLHQTIYNRHL